MADELPRKTRYRGDRRTAKLILRGAFSRLLQVYQYGVGPVATLTANSRSITARVTSN